jgi:PD-(D/E)XK endonuclease
VELTPSQKGAIAEAAIAARAIELGIAVYRPLMEGGRYDLIFDIGPQLLRIQCKFASKRGSIIGIPVRTSRYTPRGYHVTTYTADEIDAVVAYCPELRQSYYLPMSMVAGRSYIHLRLDPAKNCQTRRINFASDYELGAIAQLGERVTGSHEVAGSSPASSTPKPSARAALF